MSARVEFPVAAVSIDGARSPFRLGVVPCGGGGPQACLRAAPHQATPETCPAHAGGQCGPPGLRLERRPSRVALLPPGIHGDAGAGECIRANSPIQMEAETTQGVLVCR